MTIKQSLPAFRRRRRMWAALLKKVWDVDALKCPECSSCMKVISFIEQPSVIRRILKPLELFSEPDVDYVPWWNDVPSNRDWMICLLIWLQEGGVSCGWVSHDYQLIVTLTGNIAGGILDFR